MRHLHKAFKIAFLLSVLFLPTALLSAQQPGNSGGDPRPSAAALPPSGLNSTDDIDRARRGAELDKVNLERSRLRLEIDNADRNLLSVRGFVNLLYSNGVLLLGVLGALFGLHRYLSERRRHREELEEERFADVVKSLGGSAEHERMGAAMLLSSFLRPEYKRFFIQVFNLVSGNLRLIGNTPESEKLFAFRQALVSVYREAFPKARQLVARGNKDGADAGDGEIEAYLDSAEVSLQGAYLVGADLCKSWLRKANLDQAILRAAKFRNANLDGASFVQANCEQADFTSANLECASFKEAELSHADFRGCLIKGASFEKADLRHARMMGISADCVTFVGANMEKADLSNADFLGQGDVGQSSHIEDASNLSGTKLYNVRGLTEQQRDICRAKGALLAPPEPGPNWENDAPDPSPTDDEDDLDFPLRPTN